MPEPLLLDPSARPSADLLQAIVDGSPDAIVVVDAAGRIAFVNPQVERMFGYPRSEILGKPVEALVPERLAGAHAEHRRGFAARPHARGMGTGLEIHGRRKDGSEFPAEVSLSPIHTAHGLLVSSTIRDVTDRMAERRQIEDLQKATLNILADFATEKGRYEETQRATFNILDDFEGEKRRTETIQRATFNILDDLQSEKMKAERAERELATRAEDLARSNADLERFAHIVSHDLQEPLRTITGYVQLLQQATQGKLDPEAERILQSALAGAGRMRGMILDILAFARAGRAEMHPEMVQMDEVLSSAMANLQQLIADTHSSVTRDALPAVRGDRSLLAQVLQNLLGNALKFHGKEPPRVHVGARADPAGWVFFVRDNGIGIDPKDQHRLFVPFQRLHSAAEYPGSGIGLANCRRIIERHGGRIWLESEPGKGTTFLFSLPNAREMSA